MTSLWEGLTNLIIRPERCVYSVSSYLGPNTFRLSGRSFQRTDLELQNEQGLTLQCSHFEPVVCVNGTSHALPCVVYLHGNCGSRVDALEAAEILLPANVSLFAFDFAGSGLSEGEYVSLGYYETGDLQCVVEYLRSNCNVSSIGLWGRSMGAATAIMYASRDPSVAGIVLDSPFSELTTVMRELVKSYKGWIPQMVISLAIKLMKKTIQNTAKFDINNCSPLSVASECFVPALFAHGVKDDFIPIHHSVRLYKAYGGDKNFLRLDNDDHNSERPAYFFDSVYIFLHTVLHPPQLDPSPETPTSSPTTAFRSPGPQFIRTPLTFHGNSPPGEELEELRRSLGNWVVLEGELSYSSSEDDVSEIDEGEASESNETDDWGCVRCTFLNDHRREYCEMCLAPRVKKKESVRNPLHESYVEEKVNEKDVDPLLIAEENVRTESDVDEFGGESDDEVENESNTGPGEDVVDRSIGKDDSCRNDEEKVVVSYEENHMNDAKENHPDKREVVPVNENCDNSGTDNNNDTVADS